ncbi:unnamed protein product [Peronospora belbahrii]|uniref:Transposase Tc1-like domain-containing protein n=1 Tax=Peronospora belbahrii TaxID=622444 RepID=A0AAU9KXI8_9STRA|nr:unnamed protein product [Peronospora belbahrii]
MVMNRFDDNHLLCLNRVHVMETQLRADQKNAELQSRYKTTFAHLSPWSDDEAPEEEDSDMSDEDYSDDKEDNVELEETPCSSSQRPFFFDGLEFYLAMSQVREHTVRSVLALGIAKTLSTLRDEKQNESIATIEQHYPDITCLSTNMMTTITTTTTVQQHSEIETTTSAPKMTLLAALRLSSSVSAMIQDESLIKHSVTTSCGAVECKECRAHKNNKSEKNQLDTWNDGHTAIITESIPIIIEAHTVSDAQGASLSEHNAACLTQQHQQKRVEYSMKIREQCVELYAQGQGYRQLGKALNMPHTSVRAIVDKAQRTGTVTSGKRTGRPRKTNGIVDQVIQQAVKTNEKSSACMIQNELVTGYGLRVSCETIRRRVKDQSRQYVSGTRSGGAIVEEERLRAMARMMMLDGESLAATNLMTFENEVEEQTSI